MNRAIEARIAKLEANAPEPPSPFDGMTSDELIIVLLEGYSELLARDDMPEAEKAVAELEYDRLAWLIIATVNFASGRWAKKGFDNYQEHLENWRRHWAKVAPDQSEFVPSLNHEIEGSGFGRPNPVTPDLMARRAKLWAHSIVKQIVKEAPNARIPERSLFHECQSFKRGQPGKPSDDCGQQCRRQCLNVRRGGFEAYRSNGYIAQTTH
jgi:hypothetical protein